VGGEEPPQNSLACTVDSELLQSRRHLTWPLDVLLRPPNVNDEDFELWHVGDCVGEVLRVGVTSHQNKPR
jgi:hypothetical protein